MGSSMRAPYTLSTALALLMAAQSGLGLAFPGQYRDAGWIRVTWFGNDSITLLIGAPLLLASLHLARRGSLRWHLVWLGMLGYGVYNYAFYLLGAALNAFFPLYVLSLVLSGVALILALTRLEIEDIAASVRPETPVRWIGGYFVFVAVGLACVWTLLWAGYVFAGQPLPVESETFRLVAALDLTLMVPALASGGVLLWRRNSWGYVIAAIAGIQGSLYLLVLSTNSVVAILRGLVEAPGEVPVWATLAVTVGVATARLLVGMPGQRERKAGWTPAAAH